MGTTLTSIQAGSQTYQWVAAVEGYENLITNGSTSAAVTAWAGTDWTTAIDGLFVSGFNQQEIDPWDPFKNAGRMSLHIVQTPANADAFGIAVARKTTGFETFLRATVNHNADALTVASTAH
jgi:hypothetical protein